LWAGARRFFLCLALFFVLKLATAIMFSVWFYMSPLILLLSCDTSTPQAKVSALDSSLLAEDGEEDLHWRSLLFPSAWTPEHTLEDGHFLHDFSYAGYAGSSRELPELAELAMVSVLDFGADPLGERDSTASFSSAIAEASINGGVVWVPEGLYRLDELLEITASHVVLAGEGAEKSKLWFTRAHDMTDRASISFQGSLQQLDELLLSEDALPREDSVLLEEAGSLAAGMELSLGWFISDEFIEEHGMTGTWESFNGLWRPFFRREVVSVEGQKVQLDVPTRYLGKVRDGVSLRLESGYLSECGIQDLSVSTAVEWEQAWQYDRAHAILFKEVRDCWVRNVHSFEAPNQEEGYHLQSGGVKVQASKRVTIVDSVMEKPQNRGPGGNGYLFELSTSSEILIKDCRAREGRHNFIQNWDFGTSGSVFLRTDSSGGRSFHDSTGAITSVGTSEFHHSLAMANLIDQSSVDDGWKAVNRLFFSSGAGHSATENVFWNIQGEGFLASLQFGNGYVIGTSGVELSVTVENAFESHGTAPEDYTEGIDRGEYLVPQSLFEAQLELRLGE
jgi:hypothetical protein